MKDILIATGNAHKVEEFKAMLEPLGYHIRSLKDLDEKIEIDETGTTFEENSLIKARTLHQILGCGVMADDSGIMIDALDGAPGVYSARFLGEDTSYKVKNQYILDALKDKERGARFVCVIAYVNEKGEEKTFRGEVIGEIAHEMIGSHGFGYDPIFYYPPYGTTLANVSEEMKNAVSHRGKALEQLVAYLEGEC